MSRVLSIRSSLEGRRSSNTLPVLQKRSINNSPASKISIDDLSNLKMQICDTELKIRQIRSKTVRMKNEIQDRKSAVEKVLNKNNDTKSITTASESTIAQLKENVNSLTNTLNARLEEKNALAASDTLYQSEEMERELKIYFLELKRVTGQLDEMEKEKVIINRELSKLYQQIESFKNEQKKLDSLNEAINEVVDKIVVYQKGDLKIERFEVFKQLKDCPKNTGAIEQKLVANCKFLQEEIRIEKEKLSNIKKNDEIIMEELQAIVEDQSNKINEAIEALKAKAEEAKND